MHMPCVCRTSKSGHISVCSQCLKEASRSYQFCIWCIGMVPCVLAVRAEHSLSANVFILLTGLVPLTFKFTAVELLV